MTRNKVRSRSQLGLGAWKSWRCIASGTTTVTTMRTTGIFCCVSLMLGRNGFTESFQSGVSSRTIEWDRGRMGSSCRVPEKSTNMQRQSNLIISKTASAPNYYSSSSEESLHQSVLKKGRPPPSHTSLMTGLWPSRISNRRQNKGKKVALLSTSSSTTTNDNSLQPQLASTLSMYSWRGGPLSGATKHHAQENTLQGGPQMQLPPQATLSQLERKIKTTLQENTQNTENNFATTTTCSTSSQVLSHILTIDQINGLRVEGLRNACLVRGLKKVRKEERFLLVLPCHQPSLVHIVS